MYGQVEPLQNGTIIEAKEDGDNQNIYRYLIEGYISQGSSGIVYKAKRIRKATDTNGELVILKEYYPYNSTALDLYYRRGGVIVKSGYEEIPFCSRYLATARYEKSNNNGCSGGGKSSSVCLIKKVLCAKLIHEPDNDEEVEWAGKTVGIFIEMERFSNAYSYSNIIESIKEELDKDIDDDRRVELQQLLSQDRDSLSIYGIVTLIYNICKSIGTIHGNGWVHRDLKLNNILFENNTGDDFLQGLAILVDFGSAKELIPGTTPLHADKGEHPYTVGTTKGYQPPEILDENIEKYAYDGWTKAADIYQLGCIMYYLLCDEETSYDVDKIDCIIEKYKLDNSILKLLKEVIYKTMAANPADRLSNVLDLKKKLEIIQMFTGPMGEEIKRRVLFEYEINKNGKASEEDYTIINGIIESIRDEIIKKGLYQDDYRDILCDDNCVIALSQLEDVARDIITFGDQAGDYERAAIFGIFYYRSVLWYRKKDKTIEADPNVLSIFAYSAWMLTRHETCESLFQELFRFSNNKCIIFESSSEIKFVMHYKYASFLAIKEGFINKNVYHKIQYELSQMQLLLDEVSEYSKKNYYFLNAEMKVYSRDFYSALNILDSIYDKSNEVDKINTLLFKADIIANQLFQYVYAIEVLNTAYTLARKNSDYVSQLQMIDWMAHMYLSRGAAYYNLNMFAESEYDARKAKELYTSLLSKRENAYEYRNRLSECKELLGRLSQRKLQMNFGELLKITDKEG